MRTTNKFGHEGQTTEFKSCITESANHKGDQMFIVFTAACAMMNSEGGKIYIGVDDYGNPIRENSYGIKGDQKKLHCKNNDAYARFINARIADYFIDPKYVRGIMHAEETDDENVIVITVQEADRVIFLKNKVGEKFAFRREGASSRQMNCSMISQRKSELAGKKKADKANRRINENWQTIMTAIQEKKKIKVYGYLSSNSNAKSDRILEPSCFICDDRSIWAYEEAKAELSPMRQFRLSRMGYVELLDEEWEHESEHTAPHIDAFEWTRSTEPEIEISIALGPKAYNYLLENSPRAKEYVTEASDGMWIFNACVHCLDPVKSFCKACSDIIDIYCPEELKKELGMTVETESIIIEQASDNEAITSKQHDEGLFTRLVKNIKTFFTNIAQTA